MGARRDVMANRPARPRWLGGYPSVLLTHKPTGTQAHCDLHRRIGDSVAAARGLLAARVWAERHGLPEPGAIGRVRTYDMAPFLGLPPMVRCHKSGTVVGDPQGVLGGDLDRLALAARRA